MTIHTCPGCGALVTPQLARCRRCGRYLHGSRVEGWLHAAVPAALAHAPATAAVGLALVVSHLVLAVRTGSSPLASSSYALVLAGAIHGPHMLLGQWWRVATSPFVHHDLLHLAMNVFALGRVGAMAEAMVGARRMWVAYAVCGALSMSVSSAWSIWAAPAVGEAIPLLTGWRSDVLIVSAGASGAISGLIGLVWSVARRRGPSERATAAAMKGWAVTMVVFGIVVPGINNVAHAAGFAVGWVVGAATRPLGQSTAPWRALWSFAAWGGVLGTGIAFAAAMRDARDLPGHLKQSAEGASLLGFTVVEPVAFDDSDDVFHATRCVRAEISSDQARLSCEIATRALPHFSPAFLRLAELDEATDPDRADRLRAVAVRVGR